MFHFDPVLAAIFLLIITLYLKQIFHWKYLKEVRKDLSQYESENNFKRRSDLSKNNEYWHYSTVNFETLIPFFIRDKPDRENSKAVNYARLVTLFLILSCTLLVSIILFLIF